MQKHSGIDTIEITHSRAELSNSQACSLVSVVNNSKTAIVSPSANLHNAPPFCLPIILHTSPEVYGLRVDNLTSAQRSTEHG